MGLRASYIGSRGSGFNYNVNIDKPQPSTTALSATASASFAEDPLTSPSFAAPGTYSADSRSYRGSHHRGRGRHDEPADPSGGAAYGRGHDYQTAPAWDNSDGSHADGFCFNSSAFRNSSAK